MGITVCFKCGYPLDPCSCETKRTFVKARATDYTFSANRYSPDIPDFLNTPSVAAPTTTDERGSSAAAGPALLVSPQEPAVCAPAHWHDLYLAWRQRHPEARGVSWNHDHEPRDNMTRWTSTS